MYWQCRMYRQLNINLKFKYHHTFKETLDSFFKFQTTRTFSLHFTTLRLTLSFFSSTCHAFFFLSASHQQCCDLRFHFKVKRCCMSPWNIPLIPLGCWYTQVHWEEDNEIKKTKEIFFFSGKCHWAKKKQQIFQISVWILGLH